MVIHEEFGYRFILKSNGVIVITPKDIYFGFFPTLNKALSVVYNYNTDDHTKHF